MYIERLIIIYFNKVAVRKLYFNVKQSNKTFKCFLKYFLLNYIEVPTNLTFISNIVIKI